MSDFDPKAYADQVNAQQGFDPRAYAAAVNAGASALGSKLGGLNEAMQDIGMAPVAQNQDVIDSMSVPQRIAASMGHGAVTVGRNVVDLLARIDPRLSQFASDPAQVADEEKLSRPLTQGTNSGFFGNMLGEAMATAPVGMGIGNLTRTAATAVLPRALVPALTGATEGGVQGYLASSPDDRGLSTLGGAGLGAIIPIAGQMIGGATNPTPVISKYLRGGYLTPTPEAQRLMSEGAQLTLGRMSPSSTLGRFEELAAKKATGGSLDVLRGQSEDSVRDAIIRTAGMPGAPPPTAGTPVADQIKQLKQGVSDTYDSILKGVKLQPDQYLGQGKWRGLLTDESLQGSAKMKGAFNLAAENVPDATPGTRRRALAWLTDQAQSLEPTKTGMNAGMVDATSIQKLRTRIGDEIRDIGDEPTGNDRQLVKIYERAKDFVSELLHGQLPPDKSAALSAADAKYRDFLAVDNAANGVRGFRNDGKFSTADLLNSIRSKGATPELEGLARDADKVLTATYPLTGVRQAAQEVFPGGKYIGPAFAQAANMSPTLRNHALNQVLTPGIPAKAIGATGRFLERAATRPGVSSVGTRTLVDLLHRPSQEPQGGGSP